jgi:hypothetical protein
MIRAAGLLPRQILSAMLIKPAEQGLAENGFAQLISCSRSILYNWRFIAVCNVD